MTEARKKLDYGPAAREEAEALAADPRRKANADAALEGLGAAIERPVRIGDPIDRPLYDTIHLSTRPAKDAMDHDRPSPRDRLIMEVVAQVLSWSREKQEHVRRELGPPKMDVAVVTSWTGIPPARERG